jgi:tetratricopeptide (TPR) repeat protein
MPFTSDELVAIHREIDVRSNATAVNSLTFARVSIITLSLLSILFLNILIEANTHLPVLTVPEKKEIKLINPSDNETKKTFKEEVSSITKTVKKIAKATPFLRSERSITPIEQLELLKPENIIGEKTELAEVNIVVPHYDQNTIYLYDLKVADYNKLYFPAVNNEPFLFKTHTPVYKENKESLAEEEEEEKSIARPDRILKQALADFSKHRFNNSITNFSLLLEHNPKDVNAQFYSALAFYNLNKTTRSIELLNQVIVNPNTSFYPEALWYLSLVTLKTGNKENGKLLLERIVSEKGFYSKRAADKLKSL